jgi:hypothetical protein
VSDTAVADDAVETTAADDAVAASAAATDTETPSAPAATTLVTDDKPADDTPAVPDKYDLKLPDDSVLDESDVEELAAKARSQGLTNDQAQSQLEFANATAAKRIAALQDAVKPGGAAWLKAVETFEAQAKADPEIHPSPEGFKANIETAKRVLNQYGGNAADNKPLYDALEETGYGSHPAFLKFLLNVAKATSEGEVLPQGNTPTRKAKSDAEVFYTHPDNYINKESET